MTWRAFPIICCIALSLTITACIRPHKSIISQGNLLRSEEISRLKLGMTREQVVFLVGEPILAQPFEKSRWDYIYVSKRGYEEAVRKNLTLYFIDDKLVKIENHYPGTTLEDTQLPKDITKLEEYLEEQ